VYPKDYS